jgi:hypothetical protein
MFPIDLYERGGHAVFSRTTASAMQFFGSFIMKWARIALACVLAFSAGAASAQHFHHGPRVGVYIGPGWGWYYPYPPAVYYSYPPVVVAPSGPPVYIEQGPAQSPVPQSAPAPVQPSAGYWYYCSKPEGYYPYVKQCPGGWQQVEPHAPPQ